MRRSLSAGLALSGLLITGAVPLLGSAQAAACPSWTDPKGDATTDQSGIAELADANMDIVSASLTTTADTVVAKITSAKMSESASDFGDEFHIEFTVNGKVVQMYADRGLEFEGTQGPGFGAGFYNTTDDTSVSGATVTHDVKTSTVTIVGKVADLTTAVGSSVVGKPATGILAATFDYVQAPVLGGATVFQYDEAKAPAGSTVTFGAACGGSGPAPAPTPTPSPTPSPTTPTTPPTTGTAGYPTAGCNTIVDPKGDATPSLSTPGGSATFGSNDPDLDITGVALKTTDTELLAFLRIDKLGTTSTNGDGHRFEFTFTFAGKVFNVIGGETGAVFGPVQENGPFFQYPYVSVDATATEAIKASQVFDRANSMVILGVSRADVSKAAGSTLAGNLTAVSTLSRFVLPAYTFVADRAMAEKVENRTYTVGVSPCFGPPAATVANIGRTSVQYSDAAALATKLTDSAGKPLAGKTVTFAIGAARKTATTGSDGVARASLNPGVTAGAYTLVTSFAGDATAGKAELSTPFTVTAEVTRIALKVSKSGAKRTVVAKLTDDDGTPLAGQTIVWYVAGKKVGTSRTNAAGVAQLTTAKPTQTVVAEFVAITGKYAGTRATTKV